MRKVIAVSFLLTIFLMGCDTIMGLFENNQRGNLTPICNAGLDQNGSVGIQIVLDGSNSYDQSDLPLSYTWSFSSLPPGTSITNNSIINYNSTIAYFTPDITGIYIISLQISNGKVSATDDIKITIIDSEVANENEETFLGTTGPGGGYIFYEKDSPSDGWQYLEVSKFDLTSGSGVTWDAALSLCLNYTSNGYSDWILPDDTELSIIDRILYANAIGYLSGASYWSSTDTGSGSAIVVQMDGTGTLKWALGKENGVFVRAIRRY